MPDVVFARVAEELSRESGVGCSASSAHWPLVTLQLGATTLRLHFKESRPGQPAFHRIPGFDVMYQRTGPGSDSLPSHEARLLIAFIEKAGRDSARLLAASHRPPPVEESQGGGEERINLVWKCNLRCEYCGPMKGHEPSTVEELDALLEAIRVRRGGDVSRALLLVTGGEPTLSPLLPELVRRASRMGFRQMLITTHGLRLADAEYADELAAAGNPRIELSVRSLVEESYDRITQSHGNFDKAMAGIRNAIERFDVLANVVLNVHNYTELPAIVRHLSALHARSRRQLSLMPSIVVVEDGPDQKPELLERWRDFTLPNSTLIPRIAEAVRVDRELGRRLFVPHFPGPCNAPICAGRDYPEVMEHAPVRPSPGAMHYLATARREFLPSTGRLKLASCRRCRYDAVCSGVAPGNAALFGMEDLVPFE